MIDHPLCVSICRYRYRYIYIYIFIDIDMYIDIDREREMESRDLTKKIWIQPSKIGISPSNMLIFDGMLMEIHWK